VKRGAGLISTLDVGDSTAGSLASGLEALFPDDHGGAT
jgi:hypothetical protein